MGWDFSLAVAYLNSQLILEKSGRLSKCPKFKTMLTTDAPEDKRGEITHPEKLARAEKIRIGSISQGKPVRGYFADISSSDAESISPNINWGPMAWAEIEDDSGRLLLRGK